MKKILLLFTFLSFASLNASSITPQEKLNRLKQYFFRSDIELSRNCQKTINHTAQQLKQIDKNFRMIMESMLLDTIELKRLMKLTRKKNVRLEREIQNFELDYAHFKKTTAKKKYEGL